MTICLPIVRTRLPAAFALLSFVAAAVAVVAPSLRRTVTAPPPAAPVAQQVSRGALWDASSHISLSPIPAPDGFLYAVVVVSSCSATPNGPMSCTADVLAPRAGDPRSVFLGDHDRWSLGDVSIVEMSRSSGEPLRMARTRLLRAPLQLECLAWRKLFDECTGTSP
jgi:hypothetical protein